MPTSSLLGWRPPLDPIRRVVLVFEAVGFAVLIMSVLALLVRAVGHWPEEPAALAFASPSWALGVFAFLALLPLLAARGLRKGRPWARGAGLAAAVLLLPVFPVGTIGGAYAMWVLTRPLVGTQLMAAATRETP